MNATPVLRPEWLEVEPLERAHALAAPRSKYSAIRARWPASGIGPPSAAMFSAMWATFEVAGIAHVTAGCETTNFRKNCDHAVQPISPAQSGSGFPATRWNRSPVRNGRLMITALPRAAAAGSSRRSASRSPML